METIDFNQVITENIGVVEELIGNATYDKAGLLPDRVLQVASKLITLEVGSQYNIVDQFFIGFIIISNTSAGKTYNLFFKNIIGSETPKLIIGDESTMGKLKWGYDDTTEHYLTNTGSSNIGMRLALLRLR